MPELIMNPRDEAFLLTEANGFRSRDAITLKQAESPYFPGSVVALVSGTYELATATILDDGEEGLAGDLAIVARYTDATAGDAVVAAITSDAEVKDTGLTLDGSLDIDDVAPLLAVKGIKVREAV